MNVLPRRGEVVHEVRLHHPDRPNEVQTMCGLYGIVVESGQYIEDWRFVIVPTEATCGNCSRGRR
jgi:hypothetical protein